MYLTNVSAYQVCMHDKCHYVMYGRTVSVPSLHFRYAAYPTNCLQINTKKGKPRDPIKVQDCRAKPDGWFEYTKVLLRVLCVASVRDSAPCHTPVARVARSARSADVLVVPPLGAPPP